MSDPIISAVLTPAVMILEQLIREEIKLISEAKDEVHRLTSTLRSVQAVLADAQKRQVNEDSVKLWLENLGDVCLDAEDVLMDWITETQKFKNGRGNGEPIHKKVFTFLFSRLMKVSLRRDVALKIKRINRRLDDIAVEKERYTFNELAVSEGLDRIIMASYVDGSYVRGRDRDEAKLIKEMLLDRNTEKRLNVLAIVGFGGIGKTTLAQAVYNSLDVIAHFDLRIWVCVSEPFDELRVAKAIVELTYPKEPPYVFELEAVLLQLRKSIEGKRCLLVLDDVWTEDPRKWEQIFSSLRVGAEGSTVLVTTRKQEIVNMMGSSYSITLNALKDHESWLLFSEIAFFERSREECKELESVGREIASKCKGLPLAIKTIASLMRFKVSLRDWRDVMESDFWRLEKVEKELFPPFLLSYYDLPSPLRRCFLFCAFFPKDHIIEADNLIKLWMALGYLSATESEGLSEITGQKYLQNLVMRSFLQKVVIHKDGKRILRIKMHDMVHDLALYLNKNACSSIEVNSDLARNLESAPKRVRHLMLVRSEGVQFPTSLTNVETLHSFWVQCFVDCPPIFDRLDKVKPNFLRRLKRVKALDLSRNRLEELPIEIGKMWNLKYLNLSHNPLRELPATVCNLINLQTLKLNACRHLGKLPLTIGKLVNLRHLEIDQTDSLESLPKEINSLTSLQTLSKFVVSQGRDGEEEACKIQDLKGLNSICERIVIQGLRYVAGADEAKEAEMQEKKYLTDLHMDFSATTHCCSTEDEVIEALELHENIQNFRISSFGGTKLPNWMINLAGLTELYLENFPNLTNLPPLGRLPSLVVLYIDGMQMNYIGPELLGSNSNGSSETTAFPKLLKLKFSNMENWEEWSLASSISRGISYEGAKIMPCLKLLKLSNCRKLKTLPDPLSPHAKPPKVRIQQCPLLQLHYR